ncbi:pyridine nucleotide-disulfide oxidoreductase domain-containing protein, putative, partial [Ixodes scapularis]
LAQLCPTDSILLVTASPIVKTATNIVKVCRVMESFKVEERLLTYLEKQHHNVRVLQDVLVSLDADSRVATLKSRRTVSYKSICLCLGGRPQLLAEGNPLVLGVRDTETVQALQEKLKGARRVAVVGNGGIATELVHEIQGCQVLWAVRQDSIGATFFDPGAAQFFMPQLYSDRDAPAAPFRRASEIVVPLPPFVLAEGETPSKGVPGSALGPDWASGCVMLGAGAQKKTVHVEYSCEVDELLTPEQFRQRSLTETPFPQQQQGNTGVEAIVDWPLYVLLTNETLFGCDFVVSATGVTPNADSIDVPQLRLGPDGGIAVDEHMRSSVDGVYAAGDACCAAWARSELWFQMRLWGQARQMGDWAAHCMAAEHLGQPPPMADARFDLFSHVTRFFGYRVILLGLFNGQGLDKDDHRALVRITPNAEFVKLLLQGGRLKGAILVGETDLEEMCENLLLDQLDLGPLADRLLDPEVDIDDYFD